MRNTKWQDPLYMSAGFAKLIRKHAASTHHCCELLKHTPSRSRFKVMAATIPDGAPEGVRERRLDNIKSLMQDFDMTEEEASDYLQLMDDDLERALRKKAVDFWSKQSPDTEKLYLGQNSGDHYQAYLLCKDDDRLIDAFLKARATEESAQQRESEDDGGRPAEDAQ